MTTIRLSQGASVGVGSNAVAYSRSSGSFKIDYETQSFLLDLQRMGQWSIDIDNVSDMTLQSLLRLSGAGIIEISGYHEKSPSPRYSPAMTDLVVRMRSSVGEMIFIKLSTPVVCMCGGFGILIGTTAAIGWILYWLLICPPVSELFGVLSDTPILLFCVALFFCTIRLFIHELGHFAVAVRSGVSPSVGVGLYFSGPVAYVDLTPMDTLSLRDRVKADLGGIAMDGHTLTLLSVVSLVSGSEFTASILTIVCSASVGSFLLTEKSDIYWLLRDLLAGRAATECWDRPNRMFQRFRRDPLSRKFLIGLMVCFTTVVIVHLLVLLRWIPLMLDEVQSHGFSALATPFLGTIPFLIASVVAHQYARHRSK